MHILHLFYMLLFPLSTYPGLLVLFTDSTSSSSSCTQSRSLRALGLIIGSRRPFILLLSLLLFCSVPYAPFAPHSTIQLTFSIFFVQDSRPQVRAHDPSPLILIRYVQKRTLIPQRRRRWWYEKGRWFTTNMFVSLLCMALRCLVWCIELVAFK